MKDSNWVISLSIFEQPEVLSQPRAGVPQNVTHGLIGHLNAANEAEGYGRGFRFMPDTTAAWVAKMAAPLPDGSQ